MSARKPIERRPAPFLPRKHTDEAGLAQTAVDFEAPLRQLLRHQVGGAGFLERQFGMRVDVAANGRQCRMGSLDFGDQTHFTCSFT